MRINKIQEITFDTEATIVAATLSGANEVLLLMNDGNVIKHKVNEKKSQHLFSVKTPFHHTDGGFDTTAPSSIYTIDEIVVVVNDYKRHGFIHHPGNYHALHLWRGEYHADISCYPIALFKDGNGIPHIIYGEDWNHVQIMNLDTLQVLTASKSLIAENAEERHIEFYGKNKETNKLRWPRPYDYFFGKLSVSPNQKRFLSSGWVWGSSDCYNVYDIENFINSSRIAHINVGVWEHENRAFCWTDDETVAVAYNPSMEGDEDATADSPFEIHFHKIQGNGTEIEKKIQIDDPLVATSTRCYNRHLESFIAYSQKLGLAIISLDGKTVFQDRNLKIKGSITEGETEFLLAWEGKMIKIYSCSV